MARISLKSALKLFVMTALMLPVVVSYDFSHSLRNPVSEVGDAIEQASSLVLNNVRTGGHLGFDTYAYPGDEAMLAWLRRRQRSI